MKSADSPATYIEVLAKHSKSFSFAGRLLSPSARADAAIVYAFCRRADDAVDLARSAAEAQASLKNLEREFESLARTKAPPGVLSDFQEVVRRRGIPLTYPRELLQGMAMDVAQERYPDFASLLVYCYRAAGTVGLMMAHVLGVSDGRALRNACQLGIAMQLTNICRDVDEDWQRQRLYLPDDFIADAGYPGLRRHLGGAIPDAARPAIALAVARLLAIAEGFYASGRMGLAALDWRSALAIRTAAAVYARIGRVLAARGHDVFSGRAVVPGLMKVCLLIWSLGRALLELPGRLKRPASPLTTLPEVSARELLPL